MTYFVGTDDCERYNSQRQLNRYSGEFVKPNLLEGESTSVTDLEVYGGSKATCSISPPIISNDRFNEWRMARIDGQGGSFNADADEDGEITCEEVREIEQSLLELREPDVQNCRGI